MNEVTGVDPVRLAEVAKALGHPARVRIVSLLSSQSECRGADVFSELPLAQSTISQHLRVLREAGIVDSSPEGTSMVYCLNAALFAELRDSIAELVPGCCQGGRDANDFCGPRGEGL